MCCLLYCNSVHKFYLSIRLYWNMPYCFPEIVWAEFVLQKLKSRCFGQNTRKCFTYCISFQSKSTFWQRTLLFNYRLEWADALEWHFSNKALKPNTVPDIHAHYLCMMSSTHQIEWMQGTKCSFSYAAGPGTLPINVDVQAVWCTVCKLFGIQGITMNVQ